MLQNRDQIAIYLFYLHLFQYFTFYILEKPAGFPSGYPPQGFPMPGFPMGGGYPGGPFPMGGGMPPMDPAKAWQEFTAPDGRKYYFNSVTQENTWTKPDALKTPNEGKWFSV